MDWDRLATQMTREMIRQFLREPGEFLTFGQLTFRIPGSDKEVLHLVADSRPDLFVVARNDRALKLHTLAVQKSVRRRLSRYVDERGQQPGPDSRARTGGLDRVQHSAATGKNGAPIYRELIDPPVDSPLHRLAKCLENFDMSTAYPLILLIASSPAALEVKTRLYELIRSYVVRRALCGLTAKNYNIAFLEFVSAMREHGVSVESFAAAAELKRNSDAAKFPTDAELTEAIAARNQYQTLPPNRLAYILEEFERASRNKFTATEGIRPGLSIEHIMPQHWQEHWRTLPSERVAPTEGGIPADEAMAAEISERNRLIHTLGNLSLLTPPANASASNSSFEGKKPRLVDALLRMNQDIANQTHWGETEIRNRSKELGDLAVKIWPAPSAGSTFAAKG